MCQIIGLLMNKELKKDMQGRGHGLVSGNPSEFLGWNE
jgi:hypothetical protein